MTVPFPNESGSLFLIRTYVYPLESLSDGERADLGSALSNLSPKVAEYKGLSRPNFRYLEE